MACHKVFAISVIWLGIVALPTDGYGERPDWAQNYYSQSVDQWITGAPVETPGDLFALLIIDTWAANSEELGVVEDGRKMLALLESARPEASLAGHKFHVLVLKDGEVTRDRIFSAIREFPTKSNSTLFVYFTGYSGWNDQHRIQIGPDSNYDKDVGHYLALREGILERFKLKSAMASKPAQLRILLTDSCGNFLDSKRALAEAQGTKKPTSLQSSTKIQPSTIQMNSKAFHGLFFGHVGWVSFNATRFAPTEAELRRGSTFTSSVIRLIQQGVSDIQPEHKDEKYRWSDLEPLPAQYRAIGSGKNPVEKSEEVNAGCFSMGFPFDQLKAPTDANR